MTLTSGIRGAWCAFWGILLSGPVGFLIVQVTCPQPPWRDAQTFRESFHALQTLPYFFGILLVTGFLVTMASLYRLASEEKKVPALASVMLTSAFAAFIVFNYLLQTTYVPSLARSRSPEADILISALSLTNPLSLAWGIEMWGYALLGGATWSAASDFHRNRTERITAFLLRANGVMSLLSALAIVPGTEWVFTVGGMAGYAAWNLLVLGMTLGIILSLKKRNAS